MEEGKTFNLQTYTKKVVDNPLKLLVFYEQGASLPGVRWSLSGFISDEKFDIQEVIFIQGVDQKHDSFHVWYKDAEIANK